MTPNIRFLLSLSLIALFAACSGETASDAELAALRARVLDLEQQLHGLDDRPNSMHPPLSGTVMMRLELLEERVYGRSTLPHASEKKPAARSHAVRIERLEALLDPAPHADAEGSQRKDSSIVQLDYGTQFEEKAWYMAEEPMSVEKVEAALSELRHDSQHDNWRMLTTMDKGALDRAVAAGAVSHDTDWLYLTSETFARKPRLINVGKASEVGDAKITSHAFAKTFLVVFVRPTD